MDNELDSIEGYEEWSSEEFIEAFKRFDRSFGIATETYYRLAMGEPVLTRQLEIAIGVYSKLAPPLKRYLDVAYPPYSDLSRTDFVEMLEVLVTYLHAGDWDQLYYAPGKENLNEMYGMYVYFLDALFDGKFGKPRLIISEERIFGSAVSQDPLTGPNWYYTPLGSSDVSFNEFVVVELDGESFSDIDKAIEKKRYYRGIEYTNSLRRLEFNAGQEREELQDLLKKDYELIYNDLGKPGNLPSPDDFRNLGAGQKQVVRELENAILEEYQLSQEAERLASSIQPTEDFEGGYGSEEEEKKRKSSEEFRNIK